jgi:hypothetical protein
MPSRQSNRCGVGVSPLASLRDSFRAIARSSYQVVRTRPQHATISQRRRNCGHKSSEWDTFGGEEQMMLEKFGEAYANYANRTNRLIPHFC